MPIEQGAIDVGSTIPLMPKQIQPATFLTTQRGEQLVTDFQLRALFEVLREIRDECRATRLAVQEAVNEGSLFQNDFLVLAQSMNDQEEGA